MSIRIKFFQLRLHRQSGVRPKYVKSIEELRKIGSVVGQDCIVTVDFTIHDEPRTALLQGPATAPKNQGKTVRSKNMHKKTAQTSSKSARNASTSTFERPLEDFKDWTEDKVGFECGECRETFHLEAFDTHYNSKHEDVQKPLPIDLKIVYYMHKNVSDSDWKRQHEHFRPKPDMKLKNRPEWHCDTCKSWHMGYFRTRHYGTQSNKAKAGNKMVPDPRDERWRTRLTREPVDPSKLRFDIDGDCRTWFGRKSWTYKDYLLQPNAPYSPPRQHD